MRSIKFLMLMAGDEMKSRAELIEISGVLDTNGSYSPFYEFASNYIRGMRERENTDPNAFFSAVKTLDNNLDPKSKSQSNLKAMGITGNSTENAKKWCKYICAARELKDLSLDELHYVIGYCARRAKISAK